jgi:outer membrane receptor protein involved in Fe transport
MLLTKSGDDFASAAAAPVPPRFSDQHHLWVMWKMAFSRSSRLLPPMNFPRAHRPFSGVSSNPKTPRVLPGARLVRLSRHSCSHLPLIFALSLGTPSLGVSAEPSSGRSVTGTAFATHPEHPLALAAVQLLKKEDASAVQVTTTDSQGRFVFEKVPAGNYVVEIQGAGLAQHASLPVNVDPQQPPLDLGRVELGEESVVLEKIDVKAKQEAFLNSVDRKVYNIGKEIQSSTGSASDLLQNVPSVQVDVDGNVSLRGNDSVLILVDGKPSTLMSAKNRADALAQIPGDSIESIEVITNPSAKYKPDGTAGIINLVRSHKQSPGFSGAVRASVGDDRRANTGVTASYHRGNLNVFGSINLRKDNRQRRSEEIRRHLDAASQAEVTTRQTTKEYLPPLSRLFELGFDYKVTEDDKIGAEFIFNERTFFRTSTVASHSDTPTSGVTSDYQRQRADHEWQKTTGLTTTYEHSFAEPGREIKFELKRERHWEHEDNHYTNRYAFPVAPPSYDDTLLQPLEINTELSADYTHPFVNGGKLEAGYAGETNHDDTDFRADFVDPVSGLPVNDPLRSNQFQYRDSLQALYATFGKSLGKIGLLAGLRLEHSQVESDQLTVHLRDAYAYTRLHPTLHLSYELSDTSQLQLNYSHRVHRPEGEDLNPFPEYQDPFNLRAGNPKLRPEETHSIETGYQYRKDETTYLTTLYFRQTSSAFTTVTRYINSTTLLTTQENLASNRAGGLEVAATRTLGSRSTLNFSSNAYWSEVDASNLGYNGRRSALGWESKLNLDTKVTPVDLAQLNFNYRSKRLTAQGYRLPTFVANLGVRHDLKGKNLSLVFTVSDLFNSFKERTVIDTPGLHDEVTRRRNSRIFYAGFIYNFGKSSKKAKMDAFKVDDSP